MMRPRLKRMKPHDYEFNYAIDGMVIKKSFRFCKISATMHEKGDHLMTQQQVVLFRESDQPRADRGNGASTTRLVNRSCGSQSMINSITTIPPKGAIPLHYHNCEESVLVLSGTGIWVIGKRSWPSKQVMTTGSQPVYRTSFAMGRQWQCAHFLDLCFGWGNSHNGRNRRNASY